MLAILALGFSSGLPLALTASTLFIWLKEAGVSLAAIGLFAAAATPYTLKFLWAPLIDGLPFPVLSRWLGFRRGWLLATQAAVAAGIAWLGLADPALNPWLTALAAVALAVCSASQDVVIDAYRVEILEPDQQGAGAAAVVLGYRIGMIASTALALHLAAWLGWQGAYGVMAALMGVGMAATLLAKEPQADARRQAVAEKTVGAWARAHVVAPFSEFMGRPQWIALLSFILLYKLADAFLGVMASPFYVDIGFSKEQIANIVKLYGILATIAGALIGGAMVVRLGMMRSLWICGILQGATNLVFIAVAQVGPDVGALALAITAENLSGGMGTAAFVAFISNLTNRHFTATQYALLSSFASFGRAWLSTPAGWFAETLGWEMFFVLAAVLAIPGLAVLWWLQRVTTSPPAAGS